MDYKQAKKQVQAIKGFYMHLSIYTIVITALFVINALTGGVWWFFYPMIGWGVALVIHAVAIGFDISWFGQSWEEKKIKELMARSAK